MKSREETLKLLRNNITNENLIKHSLAVEAAMRYYARMLGEDEEKWGIAGLLHDLDYEKCPNIEEHSLIGAQILEKEGYPQDIVAVVKSHNRYHGLPLNDIMAKTLLAVDELTGLIIAASLVRPSKSVTDLEVKSVMKRMKEKAFAKNVNREEIVLGAQNIGRPLEEHIQNVINAMRVIHKEIGL